MDEDSYEPTDEAFSGDLEVILGTLLDAAVEKGLIEDNTTARDLFDTSLMGIVTPMPHEVREKFRRAYEQSPEAATDYYYQLSQDSDYIRRYRIKKDMRWTYESDYGHFGYYHQPLQARKRPQGHCGGKICPPERLSQVPSYAQRTRAIGAE